MAVYEVENFHKIDPARYREGDLFITKKTAALLLNGKMEPIVKQSDLKNYVKKSEIQKLIDKAIGGAKENETE